MGTILSRKKQSDSEFAQSWRSFYIAVGCVAVLALLVVFTLELIPLPGFLSSMFKGLRNGLTNFELMLMGWFA